MSLIADALKKIESKNKNQNIDNTDKSEESKPHKNKRIRKKEAAISFTEEAIEDRDTLHNFIATNRKDIKALRQSSKHKKFIFIIIFALILLVLIILYKQYESITEKNKVMSLQNGKALEENAKNSLGKPRGSNLPMPSRPIRTENNLQEGVTQRKEENSQQVIAPIPPQREAISEAKPQTNIPDKPMEESDYVANPADINTLIPTQSNIGSSSPLSIIPTNIKQKEEIEENNKNSNTIKEEEVKKNDSISSIDSTEPIKNNISTNLQTPRNFPEYAPKNNPLQNEAINTSIPKPIYFDTGINTILNSKPINKNNVILTSKALTDTSIKLFNEYLKAGHDSRKAKNYVAAIEYYSSALELAENEEAVMLIALSYLDMNNANMAFRTVVNYGLRNESLLALLAISTARMGAITDTNKILQYANTLPRSNDVIFARGYMHHLTNNLKNAADEYLNIISAEPSYANARYFLAQIYENNGQKELAKNEYKILAGLKNIPNEYKEIFINKGK